MAHGTWPAAQGLQNVVGMSYRTAAPDLIYELVTAPRVAFLCNSSLLPFPLIW